MFKKLLALCAATVLLGACEYRMPRGTGPMSGGTRSFSVFFETGSSTLNATANDTIAKALTSFRSSSGSKVTLTGYADTVGSSASNDALSMRRAEAVQKALIDQGVAPEMISMAAKGETATPVKTPDETAEQKNRVVEITIK